LAFKKLERQSIDVSGQQAGEKYGDVNCGWGGKTENGGEKVRVVGGQHERRSKFQPFLSHKGGRIGVGGQKGGGDEDKKEFKKRNADAEGGKKKRKEDPEGAPIGEGDTLQKGGGQLFCLKIGCKGGWRGLSVVRFRKKGSTGTWGV